MKGLELGSGSKEVSRAWRDLGFEMITIDHNPDTEPDICCKWQDLDPADFQDIDIVWFSPDCTCYSTMSFPKGHFKDGEAVTPEAKESDAAIIAGLDFIKAIDPLFWIVENPRALLRKRPFMQSLDRHTVSYCQYRAGITPMKPTDLFGVLPVSWEPQMCRNGASCHTPAPRGSYTGTQGSQTPQERAVVPYQLAASIGRAVLNEMNGGWLDIHGGWRF